MSILRDYKCSRHGFFESFDAECPHGCEEVMEVQLAAPAIRSNRTTGADGTLKQLAMDFKMSNIKSTREGESQAGYYTRNNPPEPPPQRESRPGDAAIWGGMGGLNMQSVMAGNMFRSVRGEQVGVKPNEVGANRGPTTASYMADHENLKLSK